IKYSGIKALNAFNVKNFNGHVKGKQENEIEVHFQLVRRPQSIIVGTLLPSLMIVAIGYATLFLQNALYQERLTVSLAALLVLYTLFSQTSNFLPKTSYVTMIDIWFLFCISLLFIIIIFHIVMDNYPPRVQRFNSSNKVSVTFIFKSVRLVVIPGISILFLILWTSVLLIGN
ncbi:unnamed protein product, partial [Meganyctiphanes norvegica]